MLRCFFQISGSVGSNVPADLPRLLALGMNTQFKLLHTGNALLSSFLHDVKLNASRKISDS
jgi:hypothetical protein